MTVVSINSSWAWKEYFSHWMAAAVLWVLLGGLSGNRLHAQSPLNEVEPNDTTATAIPLDLSSGYGVVTGAILPIRDVDYYSFSARAGSRVWITVDTGGSVPLSPTNSGDSLVTLLGSNGLAVLEEDDDDGSGNGCDSTEETGLASAIAGRLLVDGGTYFIRVTEFADDGVISPYRLLVVVSTGVPAAEVEPNGSALTANSIVSAATPIGVRAGAITGLGDEDFFSIEVPGGETLHIAADGDPERDGTGVDLVLDLIATDRSTVLYSADSSSDDPSVAEAFCYTVPAGGTYYLRVKPTNSSTGNYLVMVGREPPGNLLFDAAVFRATEGASNTMIRIVRNGGSVGSVSVKYATANGTATAPGDYATNSGTLTFGDGVMAQSFSVTLVADTVPESNETVLLTLTMPTGGALLGSVSNAVLAILDDDEAPNQSVGTAVPLDVRSGFANAKASLSNAPVMISPPGDEDWYSFNAPAGSRAWILVDTGGPSGPASNSGDSKLSLLAADGVSIVEEDDDDGSGNGCGPTLDSEGGLASAIAGRELTSGGNYYVRVRAFDQDQIIDPYNVYVAITTAPGISEVETNDNALEANPIVTGAAAVGFRLGQIGSGDVDYYSVSAAADAILFISADCDPYRSGGATDLVIDLIDTDGTNVLFSADSSDADPAAAEAFCFRVALTGTYFVRVQHFSDSGTGPYGLMVARSTDEVEPNNSTATAALLDLGSRHVVSFGAVSPAGDTDFYAFTAGAGDKLWASVDTGGAQRAGANSRDCVLTLLAADGTTTIEQDLDDGSGNGCDSSLESGNASAIAGRTLAAGGTYFLRVAAATGTQVINPYRLFVALSPGSAAAEVESNNTNSTAEVLLGVKDGLAARQAQVNAAGDADFYSVVASAGDSLDLVLDGDPERDGTGTDVRLDLLAPTGATLFSANSSAAGSGVDPAAEAFCYQMPSNGVYLVRVTHVSSGTGTYRLLAARDRTKIQILSAERLGLSVRITFTTMLGRNYQVERAAGLGQLWTRGGAVAGTGNSVQYVDTPSVGERTLFYRIVQTP